MRFSIALLILSLSLAARSWAGSDFGHCTLANEQLKKLNDYTPTDVRVLAAEALMADLDQLRPNLEKNKTGLPNRLIKLCYQIKRKAFEAVFVKGSANLYGKYEFLMTAGRFFFYEKAWEASYRAFEAASKMQPRLFDPNHNALQAWMMFQITNPKPAGSDAYLRTGRKYLNAMLNANDVTPNQKLVISKYLGGLEERSSKVYTARKIHQSAVNLDPANIKLRLDWGEFEERSGDYAKALKVYKDAMAVATNDKANMKLVHMRALRIYGLQGNTAQFKPGLARVMALYPGDPDIAKLANTPIPQRNHVRVPASVK